MLNTDLLLKHATARNSLYLLLRDIQRIARENPQDEVPLPPITAISLEGGAQRGKVYSSANQALDELEIHEDLKLVVGTSVGAIVAFIIGLGFKPYQIKEIADTIHFADLLDARKSKMGNWWAGTWLHKVISLAGREESMHSGEIFNNWASYYIEAILGDPNASFADLHAKVISGEDPRLKDMIFTAVGAKDDNPQEFSYEKTPDVRIVDALQASISLPGVLQVRVVKNKDGSEFGKFVDGGVRLNNPINVLDQSCYAHPNYPLQTNERSAPFAINPSALGLSLSWMSTLDETVTPLSENVKKEINDFRTENAARVAAQERSHFAWKWLKEKLSRFSKIVSYYKQKYWKFYDPTDILRHMLHYNTGFVTTTKEDKTRKLLAHVPNSIQIWNLEILPHEMHFTPKQRQRADIIGRESVYSWWDKWHKPSEVYQGQYLDLLSDYTIDKLPGYLLAFELELKKHQKTRLSVRGYNKDTKNVRLIALAKKINRILQASPKALDTLKEAFDQALKLKATKEENMAKNQAKRECYEKNTAALRLMEAIKASDCEKIKRAYHSQIGNGLSFLINPLPGLAKNAIQFALEQNSSVSLETLFELAQNSINQLIQHGNRPRFTSVEKFIRYSCDPEDFKCIMRKPSADFANCLKKYFPKWLNFTISNHLSALTLTSTAIAMPQSVQVRSVTPLHDARPQKVTVTVAAGNKVAQKQKCRLA